VTAAHHQVEPAQVEPLDGRREERQVVAIRAGDERETLDEGGVDRV
jgi:hypothetical protein